ncbi:MAG: hypothetical protein FJ293_12090 [Planctomycetes bacterium]|nr:hypothetical protein [Planctomycetota bacterium]
MSHHHRRSSARTASVAASVAASIAVALAGAFAPAAAAQAPVRPDGEGFVEVVVPTTPQGVTLRLTSDQPANVATTRAVSLAQGRNRLRFDWSRERIDEGSLRFEVAPANGTANVVQREKIHRRGAMTYFDVEAASDGPATLTTRYLLAGIGWRVAYTGLLDAAGATLSLVGTVEVSNRSGQELVDARVVFDGGEIAALSLAQGERREVELFRIDGIPLQRRYRSDPARHGGTPAIEIELANRAGTPLARPFLPAGRIRLLAPQEDGRPGLLGEDVLPATPLNSTAKLYVGHARDLVVERQVLHQGNENEQRDRWNKVVAYDHRTKLAWKLRNGGDTPATLLLVERPGVPFEVVGASHAASKTALDTVEVEVVLPPGGMLDASLEWLRRNLW